VVEVVRCKDCKWFGRDLGYGKHDCKKYEMPYCLETDFCSYGERRESDEDDFCDIAQCIERRYGSFCEDGACSQRKVWERLKQYEDAEAEGRLAVLPCKVGDPVYCVRGFVDAGIVLGVRYSAADAEGDAMITISARYESGMNYYHHHGELSKSVFFTREEAEAALKGEV
jgi:hypothetical protein